MRGGGGGGRGGEGGGGNYVRKDIGHGLLLNSFKHLARKETFRTIPYYWMKEASQQKNFILRLCYFGF